MTKIELYLIIALGIIIFATIGFYILIYYRFISFINQDKDRIKAFSEVCFENLKENTFMTSKDSTGENNSNLPDIVNTDVVDIERENSNNKNTIDTF